MKWTKENCLNAAYMCKTMKEFRKNYRTAYNYSRKNNWIYPHLTEDTTKPHGYWTKERCAEIASNYTILKDFRTNEQAAYGAACNYGFREEICAHMKRKTN